MRKINLKINKGFTLVETLVAISIFSLSIVAAMVVLGQGISDIGYAKKKVIASYLAQEGVEAVRNMRDTYVLYGEITGNSWSNFRTKLNPCNSGSACGVDTSLDPTNNGYIFKCVSHSGGCSLYVNTSGNYNTNLFGNASGFNRQLWAENAASGELKIYSQVTWTQGSGTYNITLSETLFDWVE